jgi:quercetin dioxygenase-like cupin family protein
MRFWDLRVIPTPEGSRSPVVLHSDEEGRAILIGLEPGQELGDHQVKEHAFLAVVEGTAAIEIGGDTVEAEPGMLFFFQPDERHAISTAAGARLLLLLAPWPGEGHYRGGGP